MFYTYSYLGDLKIALPGCSDVMLCQLELVRGEVVVGEGVRIGGPLQRLVLLQIQLLAQSNMAKFTGLLRLTSLLMNLQFRIVVNLLRTRNK